MSLIDVLFIYRNNWLYKKRIEFIRNCHNSTKHKMDNSQNINTLDSIRFPSEWLEKTLWDYNKSLWSFWIWDLSKMVKNFELYQEYLDGLSQH